jgi:hypothetical protein
MNSRAPSESPDTDVNTDAASPRKLTPPKVKATESRHRELAGDCPPRSLKFPAAENLNILKVVLVTAPAAIPAPGSSCLARGKEDGTRQFQRRPARAVS